MQTDKVIKPIVFNHSYNDLRKIQQNILQFKNALPKFDLRKRILLNKLICELSNIDQEQIIFNNEMVDYFHNQQIEVYVQEFTYLGSDIELAWNINKFTQLLFSNRLIPISIPTTNFLPLFSDLNRVKELTNELVTQIERDYFHPYKQKHPIILCGKYCNEKIDGFLLNGNHRVLKNILSGQEYTELYVVDNPKWCFDCLINDQYKKLYYIFERYSKIRKE